MKKNYLKLILMTIVVMVSILTVSGQSTTPPTLTNTTAPHVVNVTSTHEYEVGYTTRSGGTVPNVYVWTVRLSNAGGADLGAATPATHYNITAGATDAIQDIEWLQSGYYLVTMTESNPVAYGSCSGTTQTMLVNVVAATTIQFAALTTSGCHTTGTISLNLTLTGTLVDYPLSVVVQVQGEGSTRTISVADPGAGTPVLDIPAAAAFGENTGATDDTNQVQIISATDNHGGTVTVVTAGGVDTHTRTIYATPQLNPINHD